MYSKIVDNKNRALEIVNSLNKKYIKNIERFDDSFVVEMETIVYVFQLDNDVVLDELGKIVDSEYKITKIKTIQLLMSNYDVFKLFKKLKKEIEYSFFEGINENCELNEFSADDIIEFLKNENNKSFFEVNLLKDIETEKYNTVIFYQ